MSNKVTIQITLDLRKSSDRECFNILKAKETPPIRKDFLLNSILYYTHSPSYLKLKSEKEMYDKFLAELDQRLKLLDEKLSTSNSSSSSPDSNIVKFENSESFVVPEKKTKITNEIQQKLLDLSAKMKL